MTGQQLKRKLEDTNYSMKYIADQIGISPQSLNQTFKSDDVKTGIVEKLCACLDLPASYFVQGADVEIRNNEDSFNTSTNDSKTMEDLAHIIEEQRKRIDYLTDKLMEK